MPAPTVDQLFIAAQPEAWQQAGFDVEDDFCDVGTVRLHFGAEGRGIVAWSVRDAPTLELDGLDTRESEAPPVAGATHPNGTRSIDHLVVHHARPRPHDRRAPGRRTSTCAACARATRPEARAARPSSGWAS